MALPPQPREERRRRRRPNLRKLMFVLPNLFTVSSIFCGVYSITLSAGEPTGDNFYRAAVAIFFGSFFDAFDGRVARLTRTQSDFGVELDSLADVISFGVAPAILVYKWALGGMGIGGIVICSIYACMPILFADSYWEPRLAGKIAPMSQRKGMKIPMIPSKTYPLRKVSIHTVKRKKK